MNVLPLRFYPLLVLYLNVLRFQALNVTISLSFLADDAPLVSSALVKRSVFAYSAYHNIHMSKIFQIR